MRVKRLEILGFKSFKDRTVIHFDHSITGIVGPNGCGKSNIVDAFFWVMGETSLKHVRGTKSDDLIFNGSSRYTPLGLAEATLVLETDAQPEKDPPSGATVRDIPLHLRAKEIAVTRRVYRGGEGEYFINGLPARRKDIQELFLDTGVGAKGYSVIEQGQIGKVINAKPEDRRLLIEEAAGIAKYKARKIESQRKMEQAKLNLGRMTDVIQEIERNLDSLDRQAAKARKYKEYKTELTEKELTWSRRRLGLLRAKLDLASKSKAAAESELAGIRAELIELESAIEGDRQAQLSDTRRVEEIQERIQRRSGDLAREQSALELSRRRQEDLDARLTSLEKEKLGLGESVISDEARLVERAAELETSESSFALALEEAGQADARVASARAELESARMALEDARKRLAESARRESFLASEKAALDARLESAATTLQSLAAREAELAEKVAFAETSCADAETAAGEAGRRRGALSATVDERRRQIREIESRVGSSESARDAATAGLSRARSKLENLEELVASHEGLGEGPKAALDWLKESGRDGAVRVLADCFEVTQGFENAIEGWLGSRLSSLATEDPDAAFDVVGQLRRESKGRVALRILDGQATEPRFESAVSIEGTLRAAGLESLGPLFDHVRITASGQVDRVAAFSLLERAWVVRSLDGIRAWLRGRRPQSLAGWSLVDLDGTVLESDGTLRGGSTESHKSTSILGRRRAIADLRAECETLGSALRDAESSLASAKAELESARSVLERESGELRAAEIDAAGSGKDLERARRARAEASSERDRISSQRATAEAEAASWNERRLSIVLELDGIGASRAETEATVGSLEGSAAALASGMAQEETGLRELKVREASMRERAQGLKRELESARSIVAERRRRIGEIAEVMRLVGEDRARLAEGDSTRDGAIAEVTGALARDREELAAARDSLDRISLRMNQAHDRIKALRSGSDERSSALAGLTLDCERLASEIGYLIQNAEEKYGQGCLENPAQAPIQEQMPDPVVTAEMSEEEERMLAEEVERLRERIRRLGEVNTMAIEEYDGLKKRHEYLVTERDDLVKSIENLDAAIEHINKTSKQRFVKAFEAISDRFERLFPIIFGGGQAKLSLVYPEGVAGGPDDVLEAGVDIMAMPPGKKIVNISVLSGGEKALTALALIFAIFMVKPSPFCILDEVDAPLDDSNVGKFNALLREMAVKSQFIIITHNKKTMELNDTLYGVTMEEPGVSKMVSVEVR